MKVFTKTLLALSILLAVTAQAQTTKKAAPTKTATPVNKTTAKKAPAKKPVQNNAARAAAIAKAKEDSVAAVNALAMQMARQIIREDSIKKAEAAEQLAAEEKLKQEQLRSEQEAKKAEKSEKNVKTKGKKEEVAKAKSEKKAKEPVKKVPDELRPSAKPEVAEATGPKTWMGLKAMGIGAFTVGKDVTSQFKPYIGYGGGLVANFGLGKHLSFQPEVLYAQEGAVLEGELAGEEFKASVVANVVQVPLLLKYSFGAYNKGFFINVGPYGNYLLNTVLNDKLSGTGKTTDKPEKTVIDYGVAGGLGVAVPLGKGRLLIEARGTYFLGSTEKDEDGLDIKMVTGAFSLGYLFPLGR
ncbi:outer membrane beta-barrel protein [Dyadobacter sp. 32]|uniref:porin family protein n=1 Tax=Dyadobacter sp. 32 TaxID=538966 RepID=UPI0011EC92F6